MSKIEERLKALGFERVSTGGGCEAAEMMVASSGFARDAGEGSDLYILVTDGDAGFPADDDASLCVGIYCSEHGEALMERLCTPASLDVAVAEMVENAQSMARN